MRGAWFLRGLAVALLALMLAPVAAFAQGTPPCSVRDRAGNYIACTPVYTVDTTGTYVAPGGGTVTANPTRAAATPTNGTVAVASTFQSVLAASSTRLGCAIQNKGSGDLLVATVAPGSATAAASFTVRPGGTFNCGSAGGVVVTNEISVTSTTASLPYIVSVQ